MKSAAEVLARLLEKGPAGGQPFHSLFGGWQELAGPSLAEHCQVYEVRNRSLLVEADHPGWMQLLLLQKRAILARIRQRFPELGLRDIKVTVGGRRGGRPAGSAGQAASRQGPASAPPGSAPGTSRGPAPSAPSPAVPPSAEVRQALAAVGDPELRERLRLLLVELERRIDTADDK